MSTGLEECSSLGGSGAPRATDTGLFGVEFPDAWLEVSSAAHNKSSLTSVVMLMWLSTLGECALGRCERSTCRRVGSSLNALAPWASDLVKMLLLEPGNHSVLQGIPLGLPTEEAGKLLVG